jgi:hypothetical protein
MSTPRRSLVASLTLTLLFSIVLLLCGAPANARSSQPPDEFFIISSVDVTRTRLVLKRPTEVTVVMEVPAAVAITDENGTTLHLQNLRAGDTIYAVDSVNAKGGLVAVSIRRGAMTVAELHRRFMRF